MSSEIEEAEVLDLEEAEVPEETPKEEDEQPKEKKQFTPEEQLAIHERQAKKLRKQLGRESDEPKDSPKDKAPKSGELDYGQKAFLVASGVKGPEEIALAVEFMENTGKSLEQVVESKFFNAELKELREGKASADAIPKGSKRTGQSSRDSVDYWLAKGEMPENTPENQELRRKIVAAKYKAATTGSNFSASTTGAITRQSQLKK